MTLLVGPSAKQARARTRQEMQGLSAQETLTMPILSMEEANDPYVVGNTFELELDDPKIFDPATK